ncbi:MAG: DUF2069 domain-containing protein [Pontibacterium sp.]
MADFRLKATLSRRITVLSYCSLLLLFTVWHLVIMPVPDANPWIILFFQTFILLAFAPTIVSGSPRGHAWLCFVLLLYFIQAVLAATNTHTFVLGLTASILISILFTSAMMYTRWQSRYLKQINEQ